MDIFLSYITLCIRRGSLQTSSHHASLDIFLLPVFSATGNGSFLSGDYKEKHLKPWIWRLVEYPKGQCLRSCFTATFLLPFEIVILQPIHMLYFMFPNETINSKSIDREGWHPSGFPDFAKSQRGGSLDLVKSQHYSNYTTLLMFYNWLLTKVILIRFLLFLFWHHLILALF